VAYNHQEKTKSLVSRRINKGKERLRINKRNQETEFYSLAEKPLKSTVGLDMAAWVWIKEGKLIFPKKSNTPDETASMCWLEVIWEKSGKNQ